MSYIWWTNMRVLWMFLLTKTWQSCPQRNLFGVRGEHDALFSVSPLRGQQPIRKQHTFSFFQLFGGLCWQRWCRHRAARTSAPVSPAYTEESGEITSTWAQTLTLSARVWKYGMLSVTPLTPDAPTRSFRNNKNKSTWETRDRPGDIQIFRGEIESLWFRLLKQPYQHIPNVNGGEVRTQCACVCVCLSVRACANAYALHRELFVYRSKLAEAPAVGRLQLYVNDFVTMFI